MRFGWRSPANETGSGLVGSLESEVILLERFRLAILAARTHKAQVDEVLDRLRLAAAR